MRVYKAQICSENDRDGVEKPAVYTVSFWVLLWPF
jgi:hypothetical protein